MLYGIKEAYYFGAGPRLRLTYAAIEFASFDSAQDLRGLMEDVTRSAVEDLMVHVVSECAVRLHVIHALRHLQWPAVAPRRKQRREKAQQTERWRSQTVPTFLARLSK